MGLLFILFRRFLAILWTLGFVVLLLLVMFAFVVDDTALEPGFYKDQLRKADLYGFLFDDAIPELVDETLQDEGIDIKEELPFGIAIDTEGIVDAARTILPEAWIQENVEQVIDQTVPYLTGEEDSFTVHFTLKDRAQVALDVVHGWLRDADTYNTLFDEVLIPGINDNIGQFATLSFDVKVTDDEIEGALRRVIPPEWVQQQVDDIFAEVGPYMVGETEHFRMEVLLEDRIDVGVEVLEELADNRFRGIIERLPECTLEQLQDLGRGGIEGIAEGELPPCLPRGAASTYESAKEFIGLSVDAEVRQAIGDRLPTAWVFTDDDLRDQLRDEVGPGVEDRVDDVRDVLSRGFTFTEADLRGELVEGPDGPAAIKNLDRVRSWLSRGRQNLFLLYIPLGVVLAIIGFLGGRGWWGRLRWASFALALGGGISLAAVLWVGSRSVNELDPVLASSDLPEVVLDKLREVVSNVRDVFVDRMRSQAQIYLGVGVLALATSVILPVLFRRKPRRKGTPPAEK